MTTDTIRKRLLDITPRTPLKTTLLKAALYFFLSLLVISAILMLILQTEHSRSIDLTLKEHYNRLHLVEFILTHDLESTAADLMVLANAPVIKRYLTSPSQVTYEAAALRFLNLVKDRKIYLQARLLDGEGNEVIRVNMDRRAKVVPKDKLQYKGERYYFKESIELPQGDIYLSPMDLNIENGEIEQPLTPVMRLGTTLIDEKGNRLGIVLLNLRAQELLDRYSLAYNKDEDYEFSIVNGQGYWLLSKEADKVWGFMFENHQSLKQEKPKLWQELQRSESGNIKLKSGLYTFLTLRPDQIVKKVISTGMNDSADHHSAAATNNTWYLLLKIPPEHLTYWYYLQQHSWVLIVIPASLLVIGILSLHFAFVRSRENQFNRVVNMLSTAVEQSPAPVLITDTDGSIKYANPKFENMSGFSLSEILEENPRVLKSGSTKETVYKNLWETVLQGREWRGQFENKRKDETSYYVEAQIAPLFDATGKITRFLAIQEDITEKRMLEKELRKLATVDGLTGAYNRATFLRNFTREINRAKRYGTSMTILVFDLDHFKQVNDSYGHHAGDEVLVHFTRTVQSELRESDTFGRLGGEEFAALVIETGDKEGLQLAERLRGKVEDMLVQVDEHQIKVTVSIGATLWQENDKETDEVLKRADMALYEAKEKGRNLVIFKD